MKCFECRGLLTEIFDTYETDFNGGHIKITNMPILKCAQCGEKYLASEPTKYLDTVLEYFKENNLKELTINYLDTIP